MGVPAPSEVTASASDETDPLPDEDGELYGPPPPPPLPVLAQMGTSPDWSALDPYQRTITRDEFRHLLEHCYARDREAYTDHIEIWPDRARIRRQSNHAGAGFYDLYFLSDRRKPVTIPRYWKAPWELEPLPANEHRVLLGVHIAIDPGHIGGRWSNLEQRYYKIGEGTVPIQEGNLTLETAKTLQENLEALGATVSLTRSDLEPVTLRRPADLVDDARSWLIQRQGLAPEKLVERYANRFFYVGSEIRTRAELVNREIQPDLVLCLHYDASPWKNPYRPAFQSANHLHFLINGCYSGGEIAEDDSRLEMLQRLLQRTYYYELALAQDIARTMASETGLPNLSYDGTNGKSVSDNEYVWARNLLANRKFLCPVIFFEPYCMNHREVHTRIQAGPYRRLREINGRHRKNIYQEYADSATAGIVNYFRRVRGRQAPGS